MLEDVKVVEMNKKLLQKEEVVVKMNEELLQEEVVDMSQKVVDVVLKLKLFSF